MTELTDEAVKALLDGATPGPWRADGEPWNRVAWSSADNRVCFMAHSNGLDDERDIATSNLAAAAPDLARALLDARAERDRLRADAQAANGVWQANLRLQAELAAAQTQLGDWIVRADEANVKAEKAEAELAAAQQREARLLAAIEEATDPDFILGAMDNVNDMDVTLDGFAQAASRAIRAALAHNGRGE